MSGYLYFFASAMFDIQIFVIRLGLTSVVRKRLLLKTMRTSSASSLTTAMGTKLRDFLLSPVATILGVTETSARAHFCVQNAADSKLTHTCKKNVAIKGDSKKIYFLV
ncbi:hypothetical protein BH10CYA1_BH10CYA1_54630 [soil metagenome]